MYISSFSLFLTAEYAPKRWFAPSRGARSLSLVCARCALKKYALSLSLSLTHSTRPKLWHAGTSRKHESWERESLSMPNHFNGSFKRESDFAIIAFL
jgi:hypothetical protein